ncbi:MAG: hypothetical protein IID45_03825, partial [Planctomycetes bacterium]|nr:hypothetical protein [Planctomycetota bacterium]
MHQKPFVVRLLIAGFLLAGVTATTPVRTLAADKPKTKQGKIKDLFNQGGSLGQFQSADPVLRVKLTPSQVKPGGVVTLSIELILPAGHYTYPLVSETGSQTKIVVNKVSGLKALDVKFAPTKPAKISIDPILKMKVVKHPGGAVWQRKFQVTETTPGKSVSVIGTIRYQVCTNELCKPPKTFPIKAMALVVDGVTTAKPPVRKKVASPTKAAGV